MQLTVDVVDAYPKVLSEGGQMTVTLTRARALGRLLNGVVSCESGGATADSHAHVLAATRTWRYGFALLMSVFYWRMLCSLSHTEQLLHLVAKLVLVGVFMPAQMPFSCLNFNIYSIKTVILELVQNVHKKGFICRVICTRIHNNFFVVLFAVKVCQLRFLFV